MSELSRRLLLTAIGAAPLVGATALASEPARGQRGAEHSPVELSECTHIDAPGEYVVVDDLHEGEDAWSCLDIHADDVILDGNGHEISGNLETGIQVEGAEGVEIHDIRVTGARSHGINVVDCDDVHLHENTVANIAEDAEILLSRSSDIRVENNELRDTSGYGIRFSHSQNGIASGNTIRNAPEYIEDSGGINTWESANITIEDNLVDGHRYGIQIREHSSDITIRDNEVTNSYLCAMDVKTFSNDVLIEDNYLVEHEGIGIEEAAHEVVVRNNFIKDSRGEDGGYQFQAAVHVVESSHDVEVYGNDIVNSEKDGVQVAGWNDTVYNVDVHDNSITNVEEQGVRVSETAHDITVADNYIEECAQNGVLLWHAEDVSVLANEITRNDEAGVHVSASRDIRIHENLIFENDTGVVADAQSTNVDATNNWWGDDSGPGGEGPGAGDAIRGNLVFDPWLELNADATEDEDDVEEAPEADATATEPPDGDDVEADDHAADAEDIEELPGFGIGATIAGLAGGIYLLRRYFESPDHD